MFIFSECEKKANCEWGAFEGVQSHRLRSFSRAHTQRHKIGVAFKCHFLEYHAVANDLMACHLPLLLGCVVYLLQPYFFDKCTQDRALSLYHRLRPREAALLFYSLLYIRSISGVHEPRHDNRPLSIQIRLWVAHEISKHVKYLDIKTSTRQTSGANWAIGYNICNWLSSPCLRR